MLKKNLYRQFIFAASIFILMATTSFAQQKNFIDKTLDWSYKIVQGDSAHPRKHYFFPIPIISYKPETRWIFGLSLTQLFRFKNNDSITRPSAIRLNTSYSQNNQFSIRAMGEVFTPNNNFDITGLIQYTDFVENYFGISISQPNLSQLYYFKMVKINMKCTYQVLPSLFAGVTYNYENMYDLTYSTSSSIDMKSSGVAGTTPSGSFSTGAGFTIEYDNRNNVFYPTKGADFELTNCFYTQALGGNYTFTNITLDAKKYFGLWKENVLAIQAFANINSGANIPFRLMGTLGSDSYMRGYYNGRFRDNNACALQAEIRKTIWKPISIVAFGGCGTVSNKVNGLSSNIKPNYGCGLRVMAIPKEKMNIRVDYGMGIDGVSAFYVTMGEAF